MAFEINLKSLFQDFNQGKFVVYFCLLIFTLLFALRLDETITWSFWIVFLPIWVWKILVFAGAISGSVVWWRDPNNRREVDSYVQYKALVITTCLHSLLIMFELLACDKLESDRDDILWVLVFIPLIFMSIVSVGICVWAVKHERTFQLELFCSVNILQFIFVALRLDNYITWSWVIVFIPMWIVICIAMIGVLYAIILALILIKSPDIIPAQRRGNVFAAVGYTFMVVPLLVFHVLLAYKEDGMRDYSYLQVCLPLFVSLITLMLMAFGSPGSNQWWFGIRKEFCPWLLGVCPVLQEYGNITYKLPSDNSTTDPQQQASDAKKIGNILYRRGATQDDSPRVVQPAVYIDLPD